MVSKCLSRGSLGLVFLMSLAACGPSGYQSTTAVADYVKEVLPEKSRDFVDELALCGEGGEYKVSMLLSNGDFAHYSIDSDAKVTLERRTTRAQRHEVRDPFLGCLGGTDAQWLFGLKAGGEIRVNFYYFTGGVTAYVSEDLARTIPFEDVTKRRLDGAAQAVVHALANPPVVVSFERTWNP